MINMIENADLEQIEKLIGQLSPSQRLRLMARMCEELSILPAIEPTHSKAEKIKQKRLDIAKELLSEVDDIDDDSQGIFDASADIRRIREERQKQIC
jgi:hypothetical protein